MICQLKRTLPYLRLLMVAPPKNRCKMLKSYPTFVLDDMVEILYNILTNNIPVRNPKYKSLLLSKQGLMTRFYKAARKPGLRKRLLLRQKGGFLGAMVPVIASVLGGLAGSAL